MEYLGITIIRESDAASIHTFDDWGLILTERPVISPPTPKILRVDIPGADGTLDMTESLTGEVMYEDRTIKCTFEVIDSSEDWADKYSNILDFIHGRRTQVRLDDDPCYYYSGRMEVDSWESNPNSSTLKMTATVDPYKLELNSSLEEWLWDPFRFPTDVIREYGNIRVDRMLKFTVAGSRRTSVPTFIVRSDDGNGMQIRYNGVTYSLPDGTSKVVNIAIREGSQPLYIYGNGYISIDYRGGRL